MIRNDTVSQPFKQGMVCMGLKVYYDLDWCSFFNFIIKSSTLSIVILTICTTVG